MADDRPADGEVDTIARLRTELDDLRSTVLARVGRRPTGDIEPTVRATPKPDTLLLHGQVVARGDYPVLWQWVQDQALVLPGLYTTGNGTTTFGVPDMRGRVPVGAGTLGVDTYVLGALTGVASTVLTTAQLPSHRHNVTVAAHTTHDHNVAVATHATHDHGFTTSSAGSHGGHNDQSGTIPTGAGLPYGVASGGSHSHSGTTGADTAGSHTVTESLGGPTTHTVTEALVGTGAAVDNRQPSIALNWLVWT